MDKDKRIYISHATIRISVSILLLKIFFLELIFAVLLVIFLGSIYLANYEDLANASFLNLPIYIIAVVIKSFLLFFVVLEWMNEYYEVTPEVIYRRRGVFFKGIEQYPIENIHRIEVKQSFFGKLFNFGTISLFDFRREKYEDMYLIHNPIRYSKIIEGLVPHVDIKEETLRQHVVEKDIFDAT